MNQWSRVRLYPLFFSEHKETLRYLYDKVLYSENKDQISLETFCSFAFDTSNVSIQSF